MSPKIDLTLRLLKVIANKRTFSIALLICALSLVSYSIACTNRASSLKANVDASQPEPQGSTTASDKGAFKLQYVAVKDESLKHIEKLIKDSKLFETMIEDSNKSLKLPVDVNVIFRECNGKGEDNGEPEDPTNAWYSPSHHSITMCYGMIKKSEDLFRNNEKNEKDLEEAVLGSTAWTFYHEMGHALIDIYQLAHTGKEEDAADELSTYILISGGDAGEKAALSGAEDFYREASEDNDLNEEQFADSHSLSKQRFYNIICWVHGSNPEKYASLTQGDNPILPQGRAEGCEGEYQRIAKAWQNLLASHLKK